MKNIISNELAIKMRDVGFNDPCFSKYVNDEIKLCPFGLAETNSYLINKPYNISAPTYEQVKIWFMENKLIFINVSCERWMVEYRGEVENFNGLSILKNVNDYYVAFTMAIEEAIRIKKANENE